MLSFVWKIRLVHCQKNYLVDLLQFYMFAKNLFGEDEAVWSRTPGNARGNVFDRGLATAQSADRDFEKIGRYEPLYQRLLRRFAQSQTC